MTVSVSALSLKIVIRCKKFEASHAFYSTILGLDVVQEWSEDQGRGCVFGFGERESGGCIEIYEMTTRDKRYSPAFMQSFQNDKIDVQLGARSVDLWVEKLGGKWPFEGPETLPWGQRWIKLRDPDNLLVAIYEDLPKQ